MASVSSTKSTPSSSSPESGTAGANTILKSADIWEVTVPISVKGRYIPGIRQPNHRRRISIEIHSLLPSFETDAVGHSSSSPAEKKKSSRKSEQSEICYVRFLYPPGSAESIAGPLLKEADKIEGFANAVITKRLLSPFKDEKKESTQQHGGEKINDGDSSIESMMQSMEESNKKEVMPFDGWFPRYKVPLREFQIEGRKKKEIDISFFHKGRKKEKVLLFETELGATEFCAAIEKNKKMQDIRAKRRLEIALGGIKLEAGEELTFLIDICSGTNIPRSDFGKNSDPMVSVWFNGVKIHQTDYIPNTEDPIWTLRKSSLFLWKVRAIELFKSEDCLIFEVEDYDLGSSSTSLGAFNVSAKTLYHWKGERREFALKPLLGEKDFGKVSHGPSISFVNKTIICIEP